MAAQVAALERQVEQLTARIEQLTAQLETSQRSAKRQAAPFAKGGPKVDPLPPGRKAGPEHGVHRHRTPPLTMPDEVIDVPLRSARRCPFCGVSASALREVEVVHQHQLDIPRRPIHRRFDLHVGQCTCCGGRVQPRHELQTSDALGAASTQLGPTAVAAMVQLNKTCGLSYGKIASVFGSMFGIDLCRGAACRAVLRAARRCAPTYQAIVTRMSTLDKVTGDETGWRIGGYLAWLHALVGVDLTCYVIDEGRGYDVAARVLGDDYDGLLVHDGWQAYDRFFDATHQTCLAHLIRRCRDMIDTAVGAAGRFPRQIKTLLQQGLDLRDRFHAGQVSEHGLASALGRLEHRLDRLLTWTRSNAANERLANHLARHRRQIFTFLQPPWIGKPGRPVPGVEATNWRAEQALRPAVVNRKVWGGNRTRAGADAQQTLMSVLRTWQQRGLDAIALLIQVLCHRHPSALPMPAGP